MKKLSLNLVAVTSGIILLSGQLSQNAKAALYESGSAQLAGDGGLIEVDYTIDLALGIYTYDYTIVNPPSGQGGLPGTVNAFEVSFDTTVPGAFIPNTQTGGTLGDTETSVGLHWDFQGLTPGESSALPLQFKSFFAPTDGNANASGGPIPPSPWASFPGGQQVPVPQTAPDATSTLSLLGGVLLLLPFRFVMRKTSSSH